MKTLFYSTCLFILLSIIGGIIAYAVNHKIDVLDPTLVSGGYDLQDITQK